MKPAGKITLNVGGEELEGSELKEMEGELFIVTFADSHGEFEAYYAEAMVTGMNLRTARGFGETADIAILDLWKDIMTEGER